MLIPDDLPQHGVDQAPTVASMLPVSGQQLIELAYRTLDNASEHICEPGLWIDIVEPRGQIRCRPSGMQRRTRPAPLFLKEILPSPMKWAKAAHRRSKLIALQFRSWPLVMTGTVVSSPCNRSAARTWPR